MSKLFLLFLLYRPQGIIKALWVVLRVVILPYRKLDALIPQKSTILDIGCGNGGFSNYISLQTSKRKILGIDLSKKRIGSAIKTVGKRKNIRFILGDTTTIKIPKANFFLLVDVLHHINFQDQEKLLRFLANHLKSDSLLIIKEVDPSNRIPFLFGHIIEKVLYPKEEIYARSKNDWEVLFQSLGLSNEVFPGSVCFPDSSLIFVIRRTKRLKNKAGLKDKK